MTPEPAAKSSASRSLTRAAERALARWEGEGGRALSPDQQRSAQRARRVSPPFRSVLVPIDFTAGSDRVLGRLALLPLAADARVTILHVIPDGLAPRQRKSAERDATRTLAGEVRHLRESLARHIRIRPLVRAGPVAKEIGACANKVKAELIVMGRGGGRALREAFLGSTAERVIRGTRLPVLVVRLAPRAAYRRPALALERDQTAYDVVRLMFRVLPPPRPRITIVHAYDFPYGGPTYPSLSHAEAEGIKGDLHVDATRGLARVLATALARVNASPEDVPSWKITVRYGSPRVVVLAAVKAADADLLVLGTRGYAGAAYVFLGSVAGDLLRGARCDVLVVPPFRSRRSAAARS